MRYGILVSPVKICAAVLVVLVGLVLLGTERVFATTETAVTFDPGGYGGFIIFSGNIGPTPLVDNFRSTGNALLGRIPTENSCGDAGFARAEVEVVLPRTEVIHVMANLRMAWTSRFIGRYGYVITVRDDSQGVERARIDKQGQIITGLWGTEDIYFDPPVYIDHVRVEVGACGDMSLRAAIDNIKIYTEGDLFPPTATPSPTPTATPPGGWAYPVQSPYPNGFGGGEEFWDMETPFTDMRSIDLTDPGVMVMYDDNAIANVMVATDGTVVGVDPISECLYPPPPLDVIPPFGFCRVRISFPNPSGVTRLFSRGYLVSIQIEGDRTLRYVVGSPEVKVGDTVSMGCIIGQTLPVQERTSSLNYSVVTYSYTAFQVVDAGGWSVDVKDMFTIASPPRKCTRTSLSTECKLVGNPAFHDSNPFTTGRPDFAYWEQESYNGKFPGKYAGWEGVVPTGRVYQQLNLDPSVEYGLLVRYTPYATSKTPFSFKVSLGNTVHTITWQPGDSGVFESPPALYTSDASFYELAVFDLQGGAGIVEFVCVYDPNEDKPPVPGGCIVRDPDMDNFSPPAWTAPGVTFRSGVALLRDGQSITQDVTLSPKAGGAAQPYKLSVTYRRAGITSITAAVGVNWSLGAAGSGSFPDKQDYDFATFSADFTISARGTFSLILTAEGTDANQTAQIDRVCIVTADGSDTPGYVDPVIVPVCKTCTYLPTGDLSTDLAELVGWLACFFIQLWECQVKVVLMGIWTAIVNILTFLSYFRMWLGLTISGYGGWANSTVITFANYLNGHFHNLIASVNGITAVQAGSSGGGLWDFLGLLVTAIGNVISSAMNGIKDVILSIINGIFGLITVIVELVASLLGLLISAVTSFVANFAGLIMSSLIGLINGVNTAPTAVMPEWFPNCADPNDGFATICQGLVLFEDSISTGPAQYFAPILMGLASMSLLMWGAEKLLGVIKGGGDD